MNTLDYIVVAIYIVGFLFLGRLFSGSKSGKDYFLGGKSFGWLSLSISTVATQLSAISFISAPAFVGIKEGGGMKWLTYEFGVPLAMIFAMAILIPPMYRAGVVSVYAYLEKRFDTSTRVLLSLVFQISRAFATSVMMYTVALILTSVMTIPMWQTILIIGIVTMIYSYQGGMKAVVYGDVIQMIILMGGIVICLFVGIGEMGGWTNFIDGIAPERLEVVNFQAWGLSEGSDFGFWPMLLGGFFLYSSYYATDQSQVQRFFSAQDMGQLKKTLLASGLIRFPITFIYCIMGLVIGTLAMQSPAFLTLIPSDSPDLLIPIFIREYLPHGLIGILMVAIFSAAMSSLSSAINSLSAASVEDFFNRQQQLDDKNYMQLSQYGAAFWGVVCIVLAFFTGDIADTVIEAINKVGSVFYGPILATFIAAIAIKPIHAKGINIGIIAGVGVNLFLWLFVPDVFWFWWNAIGAIVCLQVAYLASIILPSEGKGTFSFQWEADRSKILILLIYFGLIVAFSIAFPYLF
ncbi:MAG: sodium/solute symporter [Bacteroidota bacterium]